MQSLTDAERIKASKFHELSIDTAPTDVQHMFHSRAYETQSDSQRDDISSVSNLAK